MNKNIQTIIDDLGLGDELIHLSEEEQQTRIFHALRIWIQGNQHQESSGLFSPSYNQHPKVFSSPIQLNPLFDNNDDELLPNGYRRSEYHQYGYTDYDISLWGLDQPAAPSPSMAGFTIMDMLDGDLDGHFGF